MKLTEVSGAEFSSFVDKNMTKAVKAVKREMNQFGKNSVSAVPIDSLTGQIVVEFHRWLRPERH